MSRPRPRVRGTRRQLEAAVPGQRAAQAVGSVRICRATAGTTLAVSLPPPGTLTSIVNRDWRSTRVARWLWCAPASKSPSQWPGTARSATSAGRARIDTAFTICPRCCPVRVAVRAPRRAMHIVGYSAARQRLAKLMDSVVDDRRPGVITRRKAPAVVILALDEYEVIAETLQLLRSPKNARRLHKAMRDADARRFVHSPRR